MPSPCEDVLEALVALVNLGVLPAAEVLEMLVDLGL